MIKTKEWLKAAAVRAVKTMAQAAIAMIGTSAVIADIDWKLVLSASVVAGILSVLTSLAGLPEVDDTKIYVRK
jgi:hypothetical protein